MKIELKLNVALQIELADGETELSEKEQDNIVNIVQDALMHQYNSAGITSDDYEGYCEEVSTSVQPSNIVEVKTFKLEELSDEAKETAREWWLKDGLGEYEREAITESFKAKLETLCLPSDDIQWSLSSCQGDGVAFYGEIDLNDYLIANKIAEEYKELFGGCMRDVEIKSNSNHYSHYNTMSVSYNCDDEVDILADKFYDHIRAHIKELSIAFESEGYEQLDYYASDAYVDECLIANDYTFTEDGSIFN